jgi:hypothetical protein
VDAEPGLKRTIRFKGIVWGDRFSVYYDKDPPNNEGASVYPNVDGAIEYEIAITRTLEDLKGEKACSLEEYYKLAPEERHEIKRINPWIYVLQQPFKRGPTITIADHGHTRYVWGWDGNKEAPTLAPSFLSDEGMINGEKGTRIHLFFRAGTIDLLGDSNVELIR